MPHGSRLNPQGTKQYSACMMDDMLVEIDTRSLKVTQQFALTKTEGADWPSEASNTYTRRPWHVSRRSPVINRVRRRGPSLQLTDLQFTLRAITRVRLLRSTHAIGRSCVASPRVPVFTTSTYTRDGLRLIATNKRDQSVSIYELKSGRELARLPTKRKVLHGVVVSPDDRYAFVTVEGIGSEPGTVEVIDLTALKTVATVDVGPAAAGIDFFKTEPSKKP